jgi:two-component system, NarL family, uhpT operon response regulator UhpA
VSDQAGDLRLRDDEIELRDSPSTLPEAPKRTRVGIVDDHRLMLDGLTTWLGAEATDLDVVIAVTSFRDLLRHPQFPVNVVLLDLNLGDDAPTSAKIVELSAAGVAVVVVSTFADPRRVRECIAAGALGYVPKSENAAEIVRAVRAAARGEGHITPALAAMLVANGPDETTPALSPQERRALVLYASGLPLKSVARQLDISVETAKTYLTRVREKYANAGREARTKIALHRRAVEDGLLHDSHRADLTAEPEPTSEPTSEPAHEQALEPAPELPGNSAPTD